MFLYDFEYFSFFLFVLFALLGLQATVLCVCVGLFVYSGASGSCC